MSRRGIFYTEFVARWLKETKYALSGIVEIDDGYVGGASHSGKRGRRTDKGEKIVVALSKTENGAALFTRMQVVKDVTSKTLPASHPAKLLPGCKNRMRRLQKL